MQATSPTSAEQQLQGWFWPLWACGLLLALGLTVAAGSYPQFPGDLGLARLIQASGFPAGLADALDRLGTGSPAVVCLALLAVVLVVVAHRRDAAVLLVLASLLGLVSAPLKVLADRPRPTSVFVRVAQQLPDQSFPSGHALHAVLSFGLFAVMIEATAWPRPVRRALQAGCVSLVLLTGVARIYVGAHWPSDVIGGYAWGLLIAALILRIARSGPMQADRPAT